MRKTSTEHCSNSEQTGGLPKKQQRKLFGVGEPTGKKRSCLERTPNEDQVMKHEDRHLLIIPDLEPVYQGTGRSCKEEHHSSGERNQVFLHRFR
ncbi:hypothetical protein ILUMI_11281 [Ignelater luminosus]|uniref:Uncharacterized protein n=1 Tax=Ignelater luminosus TaxID=2038154 RepID=A0A8K0CW84_IGNLU|nr:hypothetical protein ILUMI_11281 [Ignelater luminosus]